MDDALGQDIAQAVKALVTQIAPTTSFVVKYGGEVFVPDVDTPNAFVGGVFIYKDHVSVEFSDGASLTDPRRRLEGKGKARRHLKLTAVRDVEDKDLASYLQQVLR